jgi:hypothetical protein
LEAIDAHDDALETSRKPQRRSPGCIRIAPFQAVI